ncbi:hypothetical protein BD769DRAFT_1508229 [Suillus cothurnatus]|nr:hypothetical protein BD769DRAFT_1508229 [Suillus cothurnatus]
MVMAPSWVGRNGYFVVVLVFYRNLQALALVVLGRSLKRYRRQLQIMRYCVWGLLLQIFKVSLSHNSRRIVMTHKSSERRS